MWSCAYEQLVGDTRDGENSRRVQSREEDRRIMREDGAEGGLSIVRAIVRTVGSMGQSSAVQCMDVRDAC